MQADETARLAALRRYRILDTGARWPTPSANGCGNDPTKQIQCVMTCEAAGDVLVVIRDPRDGFDLASVPDPLASEKVLKGSGCGIFLVNQLIDDVRFADGGREPTMRKRGSTPGEPA